MKARNEGRPEVPARFLRENAPADPDDYEAWSNERFVWHRANGYSILRLIQEDYAASHAKGSRP